MALWAACNLKLPERGATCRLAESSFKGHGILFRPAYWGMLAECRPAVLFFDTIDGLIASCGLTGTFARSVTQVPRNCLAVEVTR